MNDLLKKLDAISQRVHEARMLANTADNLERLTVISRANNVRMISRDSANRSDAELRVPTQAFAEDLACELDAAIRAVTSKWAAEFRKRAEVMLTFDAQINLTLDEMAPQIVS